MVYIAESLDDFLAYLRHRAESLREDVRNQRHEGQRLTRFKMHELIGRAAELDSLCDMLYNSNLTVK